MRRMRRTGPAAFAAAALLGLAGMAGPARAGDPKHKDPQASPSDALYGWQTLDKEKDGAILVNYVLPDPLSRAYQWQFASTFKRPVRVDYMITTGGLRGGFPVYRTAYIPASGKTDKFAILSPVPPNITVQKVRPQ